MFPRHAKAVSDPEGSRVYAQQSLLDCCSPQAMKRAPCEVRIVKSQGARVFGALPNLQVMDADLYLALSTVGQHIASDLARLTDYCGFQAQNNASR